MRDRILEIGLHSGRAAAVEPEKQRPTSQAFRLRGLPVAAGSSSARKKEDVVIKGMVTVFWPA